MSSSMSSQDSQETISSQDSSDYSWFPSESDESDSDTDTVSETDTFYNTQNDFKLIGELLNDATQSSSESST